MSFNDDIREFRDYLDGKYAIDINDGRIVPDGDLHTIEVDHMCGWIIYYWSAQHSKFFYGFIQEWRSRADEIFSGYEMKEPKK